MATRKRKTDGTVGGNARSRTGGSGAPPYDRLVAALLLVLTCLVASGCTKSPPESVAKRSERLHVTSGLVAAYDFDEGSGTTATDASGTGNTGTLSGPAWSSSGRRGGALSFDGVNDRVTIPDASSLDLTTGLTLMAWVRPTGEETDWRTVILKESESEGFSYALYATDGDGVPSAYLRQGSQDRSVLSDHHPPRTDRWTHLAATYDGSAFAFYVNGRLQNSASVSGSATTGSGVLDIGGNSVWGEWFHGLIDEVRVYNRGLSASEVALEMDGLSPGPAPALVAAYGFDEGSGSAASDASGSSNTGALSGPTWVTTGKHGGALQFDGVDDRVVVADASSLDLTYGMTLMAWVKPSANSDWRSVILKEHEDFELGYALYSSDNNGRPAGYVNHDGAGVVAQGTTSLPLDTWSHLAVTHDDIELRLYLDGQVVSSQNYDGDVLVTEGDLSIGGNAVWGEWFEGLIDDVRIYNNGLTAAQVATDMNTAVGGGSGCGTGCDDGNACNGVETCVNGSCVAGTPVTCTASDQCHDAGTCNPSTGVCSNPAKTNGTSCNDANACTQTDTCQSGTCTGSNPVTCTASDQCHDAGTCNTSTGVCSNPAKTNGTACNDTNACTQTDTCQSGTCTGASPVTCTASDSCHDVGTCNTSTGVCSNPAKANGSACNDATVCNGSETCQSGSCTAGTPPTVTDGNPCTTDTCDPVAGLTHTPVTPGTACSNGNACDGAETCNASATCVAGTPPTTNDGNPCTTDACDPVAGVTHTPVATGTLCLDANACNGAETCNASGSCVAGTPPTLDDGNACTADACDQTTGVSHTPVAAGTSCSDANACNGAETCNGSGTCVGGTPAAVDDGNPCTTDSCDPSTGVGHQALTNVACDDGNVCNGADTCNAGSCVHETSVDDGNPCTVDACDAQSGETTHTPVSEGTACGDLCTGTGECDGSGFCQVTNPGMGIDYDENPCTSDTCDPATGATLHDPHPAGTHCDSDSNECNGTDTCDAAGECIAGTPPPLDDGNPCTVDECVFVGSIGVFMIEHAPAPSGTVCGDDDTNPCNGVFACDAQASCSVSRGTDDGKACTTDTCDPVTGILNELMPAGSECDDGNACTGSGSCSASGICQDGDGIDVDGNPCTEDICTPGNPVVHSPVPGASCDDGNLCNGVGICNENATCNQRPSDPVDDGNPCTVDSCNPASGNAHDPVSTGTVCAAANPCETERTCDALGTCLPGELVEVDDGNPCTFDACDPMAGPTHNPVPTGTSCDNDADACNGTDSCNGTGACSPGAPPTVDDGNPCTTDLCTAAEGIQHVPLSAGSPCSNGNACDGAETCNANATCTVGTPPVLDDGNPCTNDRCDPLDGVVHAHMPRGAVCGSGLFCDALNSCVALPPDPLTIAPPNQPGLATLLLDSTKFLYTGANPVQRGVAEETITLERVAVLRGLVTTRDGAPLSGVVVTVKDHPEFGSTLSREDGRYDLAMNGGGTLSLDFNKAGWLRAQRTLSVRWQDFAEVGPVAMIQLDPIVTAIDFSADGSVAVGSVQVDADGERQGALVFEPGTTATMVLADGSESGLEVMSVRLTEYTVGPNGPAAMPAALPPSSAYTYAVELSADEAIAAGAKAVNFDRPVSFYVDNFVGVPVGTRVPIGYYDFDRAAWVPQDDGLCVEIVDIQGGVASVDVDGSGAAADTQELQALGFSEHELATLATLYEPGRTLWRGLTTHFTPVDLNFMGDPVPYPPDPVPIMPLAAAEEDTCKDKGCVISVASGVLSESVPVTGTPYALSYSSKLTEGYSSPSEFQIRLSASSVPESLREIEVEANISGIRRILTFPPTPNQDFTLQWDGRDAYGRELFGRASATITVRYRYDLTYASPVSGAGDPSAQRSWAVATGVPLLAQGQPIRRAGATRMVTVGSWAKSLESPNRQQAWRWDVRGIGLGGWLLGSHHTYDPTTNALILGTGDVRDDAQATAPSMYVIAGNGTSTAEGGPAAISDLGRSPTDVLALSDGSYLISGLATSSPLRHVHTDGTIWTVETVAHDLPACIQGSVWDLALGPDGSIYVAVLSTSLLPPETAPQLQPGMVWRLNFVDTDRVSCEHAAGSRTALDTDVENVSALDARIFGAPKIAVSTDGTLYLADQYGIRSVGWDNTIRRVAGTGTPAESGDGVPALQARLGYPTALAVGSDGSIYHTSRTFNSDARVRRITPDGVIRTFAGAGVLEANEVSATQAFINGELSSLAVGPGGSVYLAMTGGEISGNRALANGTVFGVASSGTLRRVAGYQPFVDGSLVPSTGVNGSAAVDQAIEIRAMDVSPDGSLLVLTNERLSADKFLVRRVAASNPGPTADGYTIASPNGSEVYVFDARGRHLRTLDGTTGLEIRRFQYDPANRLAAIVERDGETTTIPRDSAGQPLGVVGPFGQTTVLAVGADGRLSSITDPEGGEQEFTYDDKGLLLSSTDARGGVQTYSYDEQGRLLADTGPDSASKTFSRSETISFGSPIRSVVRETAGGLVTGYEWKTTTRGVERRISTGSLVNRAELSRSGATTTTRPDGMKLTTSLAPDPRFGMAGAYVSGLVATTPAGLSRVVGVHKDLDPTTGVFEERTIESTGTTVLSYDPALRTYTTTTPEGRQTSRILDDLGRLARIEVPSVLPVVISYDTRGRPALTAQGARTTSLTYFANGASDGYLQTVTTADGSSLDFVRDTKGRAFRRTRAGATIDLSWDENDNLLSVTPANKPLHGMTYTPANLLSSYDPPLAGLPVASTTYTYDADRRPIREERPGGEVITRSYDALGRLDTVAFPGGLVEHDYAPAFTSGAGHLLSLRGPYGVDLHFAYDGNLNTVTSWTGEVIGGVRRDYDNDFLLRTEWVAGTDGSGVPTRFGYDNDMLLTCASPTTCSPPGADALALARHPQHGMVTSISLGQTNETWTYNDYGELARQTGAFNGSPVVDIIYDEAGAERDRLGRIVRKTETILGATKVYEYRYDALRRLDQVKVDGVVDEEFTYDDNGNRLTAYKLGQGTVVATYDDQDRLLTYGMYVFTYTANGELKTKTNTANGDEWLFQHDALGNLVNVVLPNGALVEYLVDGRGRRVGKKKNGALVQQWIYRDELKPVAELDAAGNLVSRFVYGSRRNVPDYVIRGSSTYRVVSDHLGSPRYIVNVADSSDVPFESSYASFGEMTGTGLDWMPFGFAGGQFDPDTGMTRFGVRDYDPRVARWTRKEPARFIDGGNLYLYTQNDPVNYIDVNGQWLVPVVAVAAVGAIVGAYLMETGNDARNKANFETEQRYPGEPQAARPQGGPADAFRHCMLSCLWSNDVGSSPARLILDLREEYSEHLRGFPKNQCEMDKDNNALGGALADDGASGYGSCADRCQGAVDVFATTLF